MTCPPAAISGYFEDEWKALGEYGCQKSKWYALGYTLEQAVAGAFKELGFHTQRTYRSLTAADVAATKLADGVGYFVQCKRGNYVAPAEWDKLIDYAEEHGYTPLIAGRSADGIVYHVPTARKGVGPRGAPQPWVRVELSSLGA